ncbi:calcium-activated chloride channel regulator 1-like isoform X2 [Ptychodera flava]
MGGCGMEGEYLHLTPEFVMDEVSSRRQWGPTDRLLVHEWAHLRWGVFDEYPIGGYSNFYVSSSGKVEATKCSLQVHGNIRNQKTKEDCKLNNRTGLPESNCRFIPNAGSTTTGSLMYMQFLPSITEFCHSNSSDPAALHNREAPNRQNQLCAGRSTWDVMSKSDDFIDGRNPPVPEDAVVDTMPVYRFVRSRERRVVLVLDRSGSMEGRRLTKLRQAASTFIRKTIDQGNYLGIVEFSDFAQELAPMTLIDGKDSRETLIARLPHSVGGWTSIGGAVLKAIEVLRAGELDPAGAAILVISDGGENRSPTIPEIHDVIEESGVVIDTIAYSEQADENLASLAANTGGMSFFYSGDDDSTVLDDAFTTTVTGRGEETSNQNVPIKLWSGMMSIEARKEASGHVYIDSTVGGGTEFVFTYTESRIAAVIERPDGSVIDKHYVGYSVDSQFKRVTFYLNETAQTGKWVFNVTNLFYIPQVVTISINSHPSNPESEPIKVTSKLSDTEVDYRVSKLVTIYADVTKGYLPVIGVNVTAVVDRPAVVDGETGTKATLRLLDNGAGADVEKNDGVYSGHFLEFTADGHYGVRVTVDNEHGKGQIVVLATDRPDLSVNSDNATSITNMTYEEVDPFNRVVSSGSFQLMNYRRFNSEEELDTSTEIPDIYAPSRITDLSIVSVSRETRDVTLRWTAPGDDLDRGIVAWYDLRISDTFSELYDSFESATMLNSSNVVEGDLSSPEQSGSIEIVVVKLPVSVSTFKFMISIRAVDDVGNIAEPSNVVSANFERFATTTVADVIENYSAEESSLQTERGHENTTQLENTTQRIMGNDDSGAKMGNVQQNINENRSAENVTSRDDIQMRLTGSTEKTTTLKHETVGNVSVEDALVAPPPSQWPTLADDMFASPTTVKAANTSSMLGSLDYNMETWEFWTLLSGGTVAMVLIITAILVIARAREYHNKKRARFDLDQVSSPIVISDIMKGEDTL